MQGPTRQLLNNAKVDSITTKNNDMKLRRIVNASPAVDPNDYVVKSQVDASAADLQSQVDSINKNLNSRIVTASIIKPPVDSTTALEVTKADGQTPVLTIDTVDTMLGVGISPPAVKVDVNGSIVTRGVDSTNPPAGTEYGRFSYNTATHICDVLSYDGTNFHELTIRGTPLILGVTGGSIGFYNAAAQPQQVLNGYTSNHQSVNYSGIVTGTAGAVYAQVNDLNNLRIAVENLRQMCEDLRAKLRTSTIVG